MNFFTITITALLSAALTATTTTASITAAALPHEHHARFLAEFDSIALELAAWKNSPAGRYAKANNLYKPASPLNITSISLVTDDQILRFFFSKLTAEAAQLKNPDATFGTNSPFSLMSEAEFAKYVSKSGTLDKDGGLLRGFGGEATTAPDANNSTDAVGASRTRSMDWGKSGCVAGVKDQGWCGSCWAFAAVAALESAYCLKYGSLTRCSEQQVTSCDSSSYGCDGGWPSRALSYVRAHGGLCTSSAYPYSSGSSGETGSCDSSLCATTPLTITAIKGVAASDAGFVAAINRQPVAVTVAAGNPTWKQYTGGVVSACETTAEDHAVLAVGYDATSFRLKNQWGTAWGAGGYIKLKRRSSTEAACSLINKNAVYPVVA